MNNRVRLKFLLSGIIILLFIIFILLEYFPDKQGLGPFFSLSIIWIGTLYTSLFFTLLVVVLRSIKVIKSISFLYIFNSLLSFLLGFFGMILFLFKLMAVKVFMLLHVFSFVLGVIMLVDVLYLSNIEQKKKAIQ